MRPPSSLCSVHGDALSSSLLPALPLHPLGARRNGRRAGLQRDAALGAAPGVPGDEPDRRDAHSGRASRAGGSGRRRHRRVPRRNARSRPQRPASPAPRLIETRRGAPAARLVFEQVPRGGDGLSRHRENLQAVHAARSRRRPAGHERHPCGARQRPLSSEVRRLSDRDAEVAGGRRSDLCGPRGRRPSLLRGLSRRRAMGRERNGEGLVRAGQVAAVLPRAPRRPRARHGPGEPLREPGLLTGAALKRALVARARALGFDAVRVTAPDAAGPEMRARLEAWLAQGYHGSMDWMADTAERRSDPRALWPDVTSIVMLGLNYGPEEDPLAALERRDRGAISVYAR